MRHTYAGQPKYTWKDGIPKSDRIGWIAGWTAGIVFWIYLLGRRFIDAGTTRSDIRIATGVILAAIMIGFFLYKLIRDKEIDWMYIIDLFLLPAVILWI